MPETLKDKTIKGLAWSFIDKFGSQAVYLVSGIIIARILTQADYGLTGMLAIFVALSNVLLDSGFGGALIKKRDAAQTDFNAVFYFNVVTAVILYILLFFAAPLVARFYEEPQLVLLSRVLFLTILFNSLNLIQSVILTKTLRLGQLAKLNFTALLLSSIVAVILAIRGYGVWALVAQTVLLSAFKSLLFWLFNPWRPTWEFSMKPLKESFGFSSRMLLSGIINVIFNNIYTVIIGKGYNKVELGYYQLANKYQDIPVSIISNTFRTVSLPVFANVNNDDERLRRVLTKINKSIGFVVFPVLLGIIVVAEPLLVGLVGDKWLPSVDIFRILLVSGMFSVFTNVFGELFIAKGKSGIYLKLEIIKKIFLVVAIVCTYRYGVIGLAIGWAAYSFISMIISSWYAFRTIKYPVHLFYISIAPYLILALIMAGVVYSFEYISMNEYLRMGIQIITGALFYAGGCLVLKLEMTGEVFHLFGKGENRTNGSR